MKLTRHNGRTSKGKAYSVKHNDRKFDLENADHIDKDRAEENIYWDYHSGYYLSPLAAILLRYILIIHTIDSKGGIHTGH